MNLVGFNKLEKAEHYMLVSCTKCGAVMEVNSTEPVLRWRGKKELKDGTLDGCFEIKCMHCEEKIYEYAATLPQKRIVLQRFQKAIIPGWNDCDEELDD